MCTHLAVTSTDSLVWETQSSGQSQLQQQLHVLVVDTDA